MSSCPGDSTATCISNYCGGCNAIWLTPDGKPAQCNIETKCPPDQPEVQCFKDPCQVSVYLKHRLLFYESFSLG